MPAVHHLHMLQVRLIGGMAGRCSRGPQLVIMTHKRARRVRSSCPRPGTPRPGPPDGWVQSQMRAHSCSYDPLIAMKRRPSK